MVQGMGEEKDVRNGVLRWQWCEKAENGMIIRQSILALKNVTFEAKMANFESRSVNLNLE